MEVLECYKRARMHLGKYVPDFRVSQEFDVVMTTTIKCKTRKTKIMEAIGAIPLYKMDPQYCNYDIYVANRLLDFKQAGDS